MFTIAKGTVLTAKIIEQAIDYNEKCAILFQLMQDYYKGEHPILKRKKENERLKNNKTVTNHAKYITKINVGYLLGNPIDYKPKKGQTVDLKPVLEQYDKQTIANVDSEVGTMSSKFGKGGEYIYNVENDVRSRAIDPRNYVIIYDNTMEHKKLYGIIYSISYEADKKKYDNVMVMDEKQIQYYNSDLSGVTQTQQHSFGRVPLISYANNEDEEGDYYQVTSLIDAYNLLMSDRVNDKEQLVEAILVIYGFKLTKAQQEQIKEYGILGVPDADGKAEYIMKEMQEESIEVLRKALREDIHKISMTPDLSDENFAGNDSGVAIKYKLIAFELNTATKESYFKIGLKERFVIYNNYLTKLSKSKEIQAYQVEPIFKRKLPQNDFETSQMASNAKGLISDKTLVSQFSFVDDAEAELEQAKADALERAQALTEEFGTATPSGEAKAKAGKDKKPVVPTQNKK